MEEKQIIETLMAKIEAMRSAQRAYFARRMQADQKESMGLEKSLDDYIKQLRRRGYAPNERNDSTEQKTMF